MCGFIVRWLATEESLALDRTQGILTHMKERLGTDIHLWRQGNIIRLSNKKRNPILASFLELLPHAIIQFPVVYVV